MLSTAQLADELTGGVIRPEDPDYDDARAVFPGGFDRRPRRRGRRHRDRPSEMKGLEIDPDSRSAWAETGLTAGEYTTAAGAHGLATGFGDTGSVGIGGITLGGGVGFLVRKHGLTIDDLLAAEIVTAGGELLRVDAENHPDLFWAIRGGGGNFGMATRFRFRLHEVDAVGAAC
jgi:FAD/FMN-containing dehydrogenase